MNKQNGVTTDNAHHGAADGPPKDRGGNLRQSERAEQIVRWLAQVYGTVTVRDGIAVDESGYSVDLTSWLYPIQTPAESSSVVKGPA